MWHKCYIFLEREDNGGFSLRLHALFLALTEELCVAFQSDPVDKALPTTLEGMGSPNYQQSGEGLGGSCVSLSNRESFFKC